jgi:DNA-binding response OmpR family regulator
LIRHVWPEAHSEGVSEEALDALVRRVRERIAQAGGERSYIVTLRGQGFRLEV